MVVRAGIGKELLGPIEGLRGRGRLIIMLTVWKDTEFAEAGWLPLSRPLATFARAVTSTSNPLYGK